MKESEAPLGFRVPPRRRLLEFRIWLYSQRLDRDDLLWPAVLNVFELVAFADVHFSSGLRIIGRLGKQRDVVLLDDAEPHAVAVELTLLAYGDPARSGTSEVTFMASRVWSLYGAPWLQPVAIAGKSAAPRNRKNKRDPLRLAATGCLRRSMVSRASAVGCHPLREVPSLRRRGSISFRLSRLSLAAAVRARALVTTTTGACHADHGSILVGYGSARGRVVLSFDLGVQGDGQTRAACAEGTWSRRAKRRARSTEQAMLHRAA